MAGLCWLLLWLGATGWAAEPVALPSTEDPEVWRAPLDMAGLTIGGPEARVRIVTTEQGVWFIESTTAQGQVRRLRVERPRSRRDREDIAYLAQGVARDAGPAPTPLVQQAPRMPPPPPAPIEGRPAPSSPTSARAPGPEAEPVLEMPALRELVPEQSTVTRSRERNPSDSPPSVESIEYWSAGGGTGVAPFDIRIPIAFRGEAETIPGIGLGLLLFTDQRSAVRIAWQTHVSRALVIGPRHLQRRMVATDLELEYLRRLVGPAHAGAAISLSYRTFRQQGAPIHRGVVPVVKPRVLITALRGRRLATDLWADGGLDLGRVLLVQEDGTEQYLAPFELGVGVRFRFRGSGDLYDADRTPGK